jgi:hypothetical protein
VRRDHLGPRKDRVLIRNNRAFDTGSEKIWNTLNKGVRRIARIAVTMANAMGSDNGRTSSTDTWRRPRTTSRAATRFRSECEDRARYDVWRRTLYIGVYSTTAKYQRTVLIPPTTKATFT